MAPLGPLNFRPQKILPTPSKHIISTPVPKIKVSPPPPKKKSIISFNQLSANFNCHTLIFVSGHGVKHIRFLLPYYDEQRVDKNRQQQHMVGNFTWTHIILKVLFCVNYNVSLSEQNLSYELKIRAGVHKKFMLIRDTTTGLIQFAYKHRIFHASTLSTLSNAI